jgi:hypothetical protein
VAARLLNLYRLRPSDFLSMIPEIEIWRAAQLIAAVVLIENRPADIRVNASTRRVSCGATHPGRAPAALALVADHAISR